VGAQKANSYQLTLVLVSYAMKDVDTTCDRVLRSENHTIRMLGGKTEITREYLEHA
jgi:ABC-type polysaccharide/polyol phosphate transport system ATPase subunit